MTEFVFGSGRPCLDFARTLKFRRSLLREGLATPDDLVAWIAHAEVGPHLAKKDVDISDVSEARRLREAIYEVVSAAAAGRRPSDKSIACINEYAACEPPIPRLKGPPLRRTMRAADPLGATLSLLARDAIELVTSPVIHRVRECANPECTVLFVDTSRPGTRRWCTMETCGNLAKVRGYRERSHRRADRL